MGIRWWIICNSTTWRQCITLEGAKCSIVTKLNHKPLLFFTWLWSFACLSLETSLSCHIIFWCKCSGNSMTTRQTAHLLRHRSCLPRNRNSAKQRNLVFARHYKTTARIDVEILTGKQLVHTWWCSSPCSAKRSLLLKGSSIFLQQDLPAHSKKQQKIVEKKKQKKIKSVNQLNNPNQAQRLLELLQRFTR